MPKTLLPTLLLFIFVFHPSAAKMWSDLLSKIEVELPSGHLEGDKAIIDGLDQADPVFGIVIDELSEIPPSPAHPIHQKLYLNTVGHKNPPVITEELSSKLSAATGKSKLLRQLSHRFSKSFKDVRERLTKAMKGEEDGEIMVENAMHAIKSFKEMKDEGQKSVLVKIISSAKIARQYLSLESPSKDMYALLENFKEQCAEGLAALLDEDEIAALEPFKFDTLTEKWTVIKFVGKSLLDNLKTPKNDNGKKHGGGDHDEAHKTNRNNMHRLLKTFSSTKIVSDPKSLKRKDLHHTQHGPKRRKREAVLLAVLCLFGLAALIGCYLGMLQL